VKPSSHVECSVNDEHLSRIALLSPPQNVLSYRAEVDEQQMNAQPLPAPPGDSKEQRDAEAVMVALLADRLAVPLAPRRIDLGEGRRVEIDAASDDLAVLCEAWAHQGAPKGAQRNKVLTDAFKLTFIAKAIGGSPRLILLLSDEAAAAPFRGRSWYAAALSELGIEVLVVDLPADLRAQIRVAQIRQFR
jgi:hypothetical protein